MEILKADNVSFSYVNRYQRVDAVKSASCVFETGKVYSIVGKSGSGKTTLLSLLAALELPNGGAVLFHGTPTTKLDRDRYRREHAAVIYQSYNLFPLLTAMENVLYSLKLKGIQGKTARERAKKELLAVGITEEQFARFPVQMSGGEQQRVAVARALAAGNELILADEPTGNLDVSNTDQVLSILLRLAHEENRCVIIVTHDLELAAKTDEVLVMKDGIMEQAQTASILKN